MIHKFKVGDVVKLNAEARRTYLSTWGAPSANASIEVYSGSMTITRIMSDSMLGNRYEFVYPVTHPQAGMPFSWGEVCLELVFAPPVQNKSCQCSIRVLMMTGCKCQGV